MAEAIANRLNGEAKIDLWTKYVYLKLVSVKKIISPPLKNWLMTKNSSFLVTFGESSRDDKNIPGTYTKFVVVIPQDELTDEILHNTEFIDAGIEIIPCLPTLMEEGLYRLFERMSLQEACKVADIVPDTW